MRVFVTGDVHGNYTETRDRLDLYRDEYGFDSDTVLIILGDFGGNFYGGKDKYDVRFKIMLESYGINYFVIRGNHDQRPSKLFTGENWRFETFFDGPTFVEKAFPHIHYAMDYPWVYNIEGKKTLVLPGAYSVDKGRRLQWEQMDGIKCWFPEEQMDSAEIEFARSLCRLNDNKFDLILSHTCPASYIDRPPIKTTLPIDDTMERFFNELDHTLEYKSWFWGHFHETFGYDWDNHENGCLYKFVADLGKIMNEGIRN